MKKTSITAEESPSRCTAQGSPRVTIGLYKPHSAGYELVANMRAGKKAENDLSWQKSLGQSLEITPKTKVGDVLSRYPESLDIFVRHGFTPLRNPVLRKTMARVITIEQACRREGVDMNELLNDLIQVRGETGLSSTPLVSITSELRPDGLR